MCSAPGEIAVAERGAPRVAVRGSRIYCAPRAGAEVKPNPAREDWSATVRADF